MYLITCRFQFTVSIDAGMDQQVAQTLCCEMMILIIITLSDSCHRIL
jgi:hypothetical protein